MHVTRIFVDSWPNMTEREKRQSTERMMKELSRMMDGIEEAKARTDSRSDAPVSQVVSSADAVRIATQWYHPYGPQGPWESNEAFKVPEDQPKGMYVFGDRSRPGTSGFRREPSVCYPATLCQSLS